MPKKVNHIKDEREVKNIKDNPKIENVNDEKISENSKQEKLIITDKVENEEKRFIVRSKENPVFMITNHFEPREMLPFSQLRTLNQKELIQSLNQNDKLGIVIKDKLQVAMINMEKYQMLVEAVHEYIRLIEWLEEQELFTQIESRLNNPVWERVPDGQSLWEWAGLEVKG